MDSGSFMKRKCRRSLLLDDTSLSLSPLDLNSPAYRRFQKLSKMLVCDTDPSPPSLDTRTDDTATSLNFDMTPLSEKAALTDTPCSGLPKMSLSFADVSPSPYATSTTNRVLFANTEEKDDDETSRDSGLGLEDNEEKKPVSVTLDFSSPCPLPDIDEGYCNNTNKLPAGLSSLISGEMKAPATPCRIAKKFSRPTARRGLFRSISAPLKRLAQQSPKQIPCNKREREDIIEKPVIKKRRFSIATPEKENVKPKPNIMPRYHSEVVIKSALSKEESNEAPLIGDCSTEYSLPLCKSKHSDLRGISPQTMSELMAGKYSDKVGKYMIVDCRYPYEYDGGHIEGAVNLYTKTEIFEKFMSAEDYRQSTAAPEKRNILIFHCEFSSERGPKMSRFLRNKDRDANKECYPSLHYPEIYLLEGGYKKFWEQFPSQCTKDGSYKPMAHCDHGEDLKKYRAKSKTWAGEKCGGRSRTALKVRF